MNNNKITLYPSNWLYNAGVIGFAKFLKEAKEICAKENNDFGVQNDGGFFLKRNLFSKFSSEEVKKAWWGKEEKKGKKEKKEENETLYPTIWGKSKLYPNYIQSNQKNFFFENYIPSLSFLSPDKNKVCSWCSGYFLSLTKIKELQDKFPGKNFERFLDQREKFQGIHISYLGAAITEMPNAFWNFNFSMPICHLCSFLIIFHHLSFVKIDRDSELFINTPNFKLTWDLNEFTQKILEEKRDYSLVKLLGSSLLEWAIKRRTLLGAWTMMNIEVIIKRRIQTAPNKFENVIDYFDLPYHITRILLDPEIASLIKRINEEKIFDLIVSGKFSEIEKANYFVLRSILKLKNNENISENDPITKYISNYKNLEYLKRVSKLLPELYVKILKILEQTKGG